MAYDLSLEKPTVVALLLSCVTLAFLFFAAGLLVGIEFMSRPQTPVQASKPSEKPTTAAASAEKKEEAPAAALSAPAEPAIAEPEPSKSAAVPSPVAPPAPSATAESAPPAVPLQAPASKGPTEATAATAEAPAVVSPRAPSTPLLGIQVGAFLDNLNAQKLSQVLEQRGYPVDIQNRTDAKQRVWYIVRVGPYQTWEEASEGAAEISRIDGSKAFVQPFRQAR